MAESIDLSELGEDKVYERFDEVKIIQIEDKEGNKYEVKIKVRNYYLIDSFEPNNNWFKFCNELRMWPKNELVKLYVRNYGGCCATAYQIIHAIKDCKAHTTCILDGPCYSMGAIMALSTNALEVKGKEPFLMFHNYTGGQYGKGGELKEATYNTDKWLETALKQYCYPFLTMKEINKLLKDEDVYIHATDEDLNKRIARHFK